MNTTSQSGGQIASSQVVVAKSCALVSLQAVTNGSAGTVTLYDNASVASGQILAQMNVSSTQFTSPFAPALPVRTINGIYANFSTGTAMLAIVGYSAG